jgi:taurine dioxygenase
MQPLADHLGFGVEVSGLVISHLKYPQVRKELHDLWIDQGVVVFRGLEGEDAHIELSQCFGKLSIHPVKETHAGRPELMTVLYRPEDGWLMEVDGEQRGVYLPWHSDLIYVDKINHGGILRPIKLPSHGGQTGFIDKIDAYNALPQNLKNKIEGLEVIYKYDLNPENQKFGKVHNVKVLRYTPGVLSIQSRLDDFPRVIHPMVYTQAETGRKMLNVSPWYAQGINGREGPDGDALLAEVISHIDESRAYYHQWRYGDMVLWDNWRVLHGAPGCPADEERWLERTTLFGDYGGGRTVAGTAVQGSQYVNV